MEGARLVVSSSSPASSPSSSLPRARCVARRGPRPAGSWSTLWELRYAWPGTPAHARWSVGIYARLEVVARGFFPVAFPRTDRALREEAWSGLWKRWCERPPGALREFLDDDGIVRFVRCSLRNAMRSQLRKRASRRRLHAERAWDMELVVHGGSVCADDVDDVIERAEQSAQAARTVAFFRDELAPMLSSHRAARAAELMRLVHERLAIVHGEQAFTDVVAAAAGPGESTRTVENRLRQRYGRAGRDVQAALRAHAVALVGRGHDPAALLVFAQQLFSDRVAPSRIC